jgi:hypothetical protein
LTDPQPDRSYTPLYAAQHSARFERQGLIRSYQTKHNCNLIVVSDTIFPWGAIYFEELLSGLDSGKDLHVMLVSPGGDGETGVRLVRSAQARCKELVVVLPDQAKSAATLFALGAHRILTGPISDLGPVDPQMQYPGRSGIVAAKDVIAAVEDATAKVQAAPETYPLWASLLSDITGVMVQQARSALGRSNDLLREALASNGDRTPSDVDKLFQALEEPLLKKPRSHGALFSADDAMSCGLPVEKLDPNGEHWEEVWRLWSRYLMIGNSRIYEGERASQIVPMS